MQSLAQITPLEHKWQQPQRAALTMQPTTDRPHNKTLPLLRVAFERDCPLCSHFLQAL